MNYGENLRKARENAQLTQEKLADRVGIARSMVAQIERGTKNMTLSLAAQIAKELGVTVAFLAGEEE